MTRYIKRALLALALSSCALPALAQTMPQTFNDVNGIPHGVTPVWCLSPTCSGGGGTGGAVYGQNGTAAMSPSNPFAVAPGTGVVFPVTDNGGSLTVDTGTPGQFNLTGGFANAYGAVTTAAPSYTNGQSNSLSLNLAGGLRVDGSGVIQPVSGTVTANQGGAPWSTTISGSLPAYATTPTFNCGTGCYAATQNVQGLGSAGSPTGGVVSVQQVAATPAGTNSIGTVGLNAGTNAIGSITNTAFGAQGSAGTNLLQGLGVATANSLNVEIGGQSANLSVMGAGTAGTPSGGVVSIQGVSGGTTVPVGGTVAAMESGTWSITNVTGTVSLPTGAATAANQTNVQSAVGTSAGTALTIQGAASSVAVPASISQTTPGTSNGVATVTNSAAISPAPQTSLTSSLVAKASPGNLYGFNIAEGATAGWLVVSNATTTPSAGASTVAVKCFALAANSSLDWRSDIPIRLSTGVTLLSSSSCTTYTAVTPALISAEAQ